MTRAPIPITVIGGYLGAGKTTLLNSLLRQAGGRRLAVIVNDFGELGIDAELLRTESDAEDGASAIVNLANGCVCCTLGDDLQSTLRELAHIQPVVEHIVIEASGVADPRSAAAWGTVPGFLPGGVVVLAAADAVQRNARDRYVGSEVVRQLVGADLLVVTKADRCKRAEVDDVIDWLDTQSSAPVIVVTGGDVGVDLVLGTVHEVDDGIGLDGVPGHEVGLGEVYVTWSKPTEVVGEDRLAAFLDALPDGVLRLKGFVDLRQPSGVVASHLVQVVGHTVSITPSASPGSRAFEAIGIAEVLDVGSLDANAEEYLRS